MSKYMAACLAGFFLGMKYRQLGRRRCICLMKKEVRRMGHMMGNAFHIL